MTIFEYHSKMETGMKKITCSGTPHEVRKPIAFWSKSQQRPLHLQCIVQIGFQHGSEAKLQIARCIDFYADLFLKSAKKNWHEVRELAMIFEPTIRKNWPAYLEEMQGRSVPKPNIPPKPELTKPTQELLSAHASPSPTSSPSTCEPKSPLASQSATAAQLSPGSPPPPTTITTTQVS
jgi:hypothetical protein